MTRQLLIQELQLALPWLVNGCIVSAIVAVAILVGYRWGHHKGLQQAPQAQAAQLRQAQFERTVAEERLDTMTKVAKRYEIALMSLVEAKEEKRKYA